MNKILWFFFGNPATTASTRIHGMAVHKHLPKIGYQSCFAYAPLYTESDIPFLQNERARFESLMCKGDVVVLQKLKSERNLQLIDYFKSLGLKIVLIDCDLPMAVEVARLSDKIICTSQALCNLYRNQGFHSFYIEDSPELFYPNPRKAKKDKLECYWFGDGSLQKWKEVEQLRKIISQAGDQWKLVTISNHPEATIKWGPDFLSILKDADAIALPVIEDSEESLVKSANRLLQGMALSVPVICAPLPAYKAILTSGENGIICLDDTEWVTAFRVLADQQKREAIGRSGFIKSQDYSLSKTIDQWIEGIGMDKSFLRDAASTKKVQHQFHDFFYRALLKKNLFYYRFLTFSFFNLSWFLYCVSLKIIKKIKRLF
jgi:hypothetical protein